MATRTSRGPTARRVKDHGPSGAVGAKAAMPRVAMGAEDMPGKMALNGGGGLSVLYRDPPFFHFPFFTT